MINTKRHDRIEEIMHIAHEQGNASTIFLAKSLGGFRVLHSEGHQFTSSPPRSFRNVKRVYGGMVLEDETEGHELMFELKLALNHELKTKIARAASGY